MQGEISSLRLVLQWLMSRKLNLEKINDEVFVTPGKIIRIGWQEVDFVKNQALNNSRGRARICMHADPNDDLHEMLIAIRQGSYIAPHRHHNKVESHHVIEGTYTVVIFNDDGSIRDSFKLGNSENFYYRLNAPYYHTLILHSPILVLHEVTQGPFNINDSDFAPFAPKENEEGSSEYMENIANKMLNLKFSSK